MQSDRVTAEERSWLLEHLRTVHASMSDAVKQILPAEWIAAGSSGSWSPAGIVEHTLLADDEILREVRNHWNDKSIPDWQEVTAGKDAVLKRYLPNLGRARANAKTSAFRGLKQEDVPTALAKTYQAVEELLDRGVDAPLRAIVWLHGGMGALSAYQWLLYIPLHAERHLNQLLRAARIAEQVEWADPKHRWESVRP